MMTDDGTRLKDFCVQRIEMIKQCIEENRGSVHVRYETYVEEAEARIFELKSIVELIDQDCYRRFDYLISKEF